MRIAVCSDEPYPVHTTIRRWLEEHGHDVVPFGSVKTGAEVPWAPAAEEAAQAIVRGDCDQGIFFCWTGTGISIAANKVPGVRAALCSDPGQAGAARIWNHANVLCLSNRSLSDDMAKEVLRAWFETDPGDQGRAGVALLAEVERRHLR
jgi:ribose 5-phosphate isomerase B